MSELLHYRPLRGAIAMICGGLLLWGCSGDSGESTNSDATKRLPACQAGELDQWVKTPSIINLEQAADTLGVSVARLKAGKFGPATCQKAIAIEQIEDVKHPAIVAVQDVGSPCMVIGSQSPPEEGKAYHDVLAVCVIA